MIDTNIAIGLLEDDPSITSRITSYDDPHVSVIVIGELEYGAQRSGRPERNLARIENLIADMTVLPCGRETARHYGAIKQALRAKGRPIPDNDIWIAAVAVEHDLTLITRDAHFREIDGLLLDLF